MRKRKREKIEAFVDGYNACFKEFERQAEKDNYLDKAIYKVGKIKMVLNILVLDKGENK